MTAPKDLDKLRFYSTLEILRHLPLTWTIGLLQLSGRVMYGLCRRQRRLVIRWLQETLPAGTPSSEIASLARQRFVHACFQRYLSELLLLHDANDWKHLLEVSGWRRVEQALEKGKGAVLLTAHVGLPRVDRWFLRTQRYPVCYLYRLGFAANSDTSWRTRFWRWHLKRYNDDSDFLLGNEDLSVQYMKKAYDHLRKNGIVCFAGDGRVGRHRYPVTILGRQHLFAAGGVSLGLMTGAPVLPCFSTADATPRIRIEIQEPLACLATSQPPVDRTAETQALVEDYAARIEAFILRHPSNVIDSRYSLPSPA